MKTVLWVAAALSAAAAATCPLPSEGDLSRVRSVRPNNAATRALIGQPIHAGELESVRRSFDAPPGGRVSISVTVVYLERCESGQADLVFRSFRFRVPFALGLVPSIDLARSWARSGIDWHRDWLGGRLSAAYSASATANGFLQAGALTIRGDSVEARVAAGNSRISARVLTVMPAVWKRSLLPDVLRHNPEFDSQLQAALASAEAMLRIERYARDPAFGRLIGRLESLDREFACLPPIFLRRLKSARHETGARQYGLVDALLRIDVPPGCATAALVRLRAEFERIDRPAAAERAAEDLAELRSLVDRMFYRSPLLAIRPVVLLEAIATSGRRTALPAIGAGARFSLLNWLEATMGFSWRLRRPADQLRGTPFVEFRFRDPFQ